MVYCIDFDNPAQGDYDRMPDQPMQPWYAGHTGRLETWMFDAFPTTLKVPTSYALTNVAMYGLWGVNQGIKKAIEEIEPGVHQFIPFNLIYGAHDGAAGTTHQYYTLWINYRFPHAKDDPGNPINLSKCRADVFPNGWMKTPKVPLAIRTELVAGLHLWKVGPYNFISDVLHDRLRSSQLGTGWYMEKQIMV